jgi:hypothetical protein
VPARIHPGAVFHVWDHFVIGLRGTAGEESLLSLYSIAVSPSLGTGHVALLYGPGRADVILADPVDLGGRMQERWRGMDPATRGVDASVEAARFDRLPATADRFGWRVESALGALEAHWLEPAPGFWVEGQAPAFWDREDIWCCFVDAQAATLSLDGWTAPGAVFDDERWIPKLGRTLTSAHVAYAETRVEPARRA